MRSKEIKAMLGEYRLLEVKLTAKNKLGLIDNVLLKQEKDFNALKACLESLNAQDFEIIKLHYIEGKSLREVGRILFCSHNTIIRLIDKIVMVIESIFSEIAL